MKTLFLIFAGLTAALSAAQTIDPNKVVVSVNGEQVKTGEYYRTMEFLSGVGQRQGNQFIERPPAHFAVVNLITQKLILQLAKSKGVLPTQAEVDAEFAARKSDDPTRYSRLIDLGMTEAELKGDLLVELAQVNLITLGVKVTDQEVAEHYGTNKVMYATPATVKLRVLVVHPADKAKAEDALKTKRFEEVARTMSVDITKFSGGDLPTVPISQLPQNVLNEVSRTAPGSDTAWIEVDGDLAKYRVEAKTESKQLPLDDKLKKQIRQTLMIEIGRHKNNVREMMVNALKSAKIEISSPGLKKLWDLYLQDYLNSLGNN